MSEYLAPKNWEKRQPGRFGKSEWIKDYTDKDEDEDYEKLSFFQRQVLDGVRRLRGRLGKNIPNDPGFIARALHAIGTDRPHLPHAIGTLIARGFLLLTNQQVDTQGEPQIKSKNESKKRAEEKPSARVASRESVPEQPKPEPVFDKAYACYPRHLGKRAAEKAWGQAVNREAAKTIRTNAEHEDFIFQKVMHYGAACQRYHKPREFIPHMATWLNQDRFLDDPSEWEVTGNGRGTSKAEQRVANVAETTRSVFGSSGSLPGDIATGLPNATTGRGVGGLAGNAQKLLARGASAGGRSPSG